MSEPYALCGAPCPTEPEVTCALVGGNPGQHLHVGHRGDDVLDTITWRDPVTRETVLDALRDLEEAQAELRQTFNDLERRIAAAESRR